MTMIDPNRIRAMVRQALEEQLGLKRLEQRPPTPDRLLPEHPSHLDIVSGCSDDDELSGNQPCLIEPHRMCSNSGYCKKLGF
jgi:hypothetical protein